MIYTEEVPEKTAIVKTKMIDQRDLYRLLMNRVLEGDEEAFEELFKIMYKGLCSLSYGILKSDEAAQEIVNDVFLKVWRKRNEIEIKGSVKSYLAVSVRNGSLDYLRKYKKHKLNEDIDHHDYLLSEASSPLDEVIYDEFFTKVQKAIAALPPQCQKIFRMSREEGLKYKEIATHLNLSIKTIETQMGRAMKSLRVNIYGTI